MKPKTRFHFLLLMAIAMTSLVACQPQLTQPKTGIDAFWQGKLDTIIAAIRADDAAGLAHCVHYPLKRDNPIPDLLNEADFIRNYPTLFDSTFKALLLHTAFDSSNTMVRNGQFMLLQGEIWLGEDGKIIALNYESEAEKQLELQMQRNIVIAIHPDVAPWERNVLVWECPEYMVRVDDMPDGKMRFVCWTKPKTFKDKPDFQIMDGKFERQGTMGGETYTFENDESTYLLDHVNMAESDEGMGMFFEIQKKGQPLQRYRCEAVK